MIHTLVQLAYVVATALFIFSLHWMSDPKTARRGVQAGGERTRPPFGDAIVAEPCPC